MGLQMIQINLLILPSYISALAKLQAIYSSIGYPVGLALG